MADPGAEVGLDRDAHYNVLEGYSLVSGKGYILYDIFDFQDILKGLITR